MQHFQWSFHMAEHLKEISQPPIFLYCEKLDCEGCCRKTAKESMQEV